MLWIPITLLSIAPVLSSAGRYCGGIGTTSASQANFGATTPAGITFPGKPKLSHQSYNVFDLHAHRRRALLRA